MMMKPLRLRTSAISAASSSAEMRVPVGLLGDATRTPRVAGLQWLRTSSADS